MSQDTQKWIRENLDLINRIRHRFQKYFKIEQSLRYSSRSSSEEDVSSKIQNQWRKLNDLLSKQIPQRIHKADVQTGKNLDLLRVEALRIQNMFKNKFGEEKHNQFKLLERTESWTNPVLSSGIRDLKSKSTQVEYQEVKDQNAGKVKSSIIEESPGEEEELMIKSLEEGERRTSSRIMKVQAEQKRIKTCGYILLGTLLLVLLMSYIDIPLKTKLFTYLFQTDL